MKIYPSTNITNPVTNPTVISVNSTTDALRITQIGSGNALVVEDDTNPDATPFVIDASGNLFKGNTTSIATVIAAGAQINGTGTDAYLELGRWSANAANPGLILAKSRGAAVGTNTLVASADNLGELTWAGADGTAFVAAARIQGAVDGTPGTNDMPGRLVFSTTADGAAATTERMRIDSTGNVGIGTTPNASALLDVQSTTKGVRMPNMTSVQKNAIASPAAGLMVFDTTLAKLCVYSGAAWQTITSV
jgi:hypothetical protein